MSKGASKYFEPIHQNQIQITNQKVIQCLINSMGLSEKEQKVFAVLTGTPYGQDVTWISRRAGVARTTTAYILKKFLKRKLVMKCAIKKRKFWRYIGQLDKLQTKPFVIVLKGIELK
jgi:hypothetical protein